MSSHTDQDAQTKTPRYQIIWGAILVGIFGLAAVAAVFLLLLPTLVAPPPSQAPAYDMFSSGEVSANVDPAQDLLLISEDGQVALRIPVGSAPAIGALIMQPRNYELIPARAEGPIERIRAVDILMLDANGEIVRSPEFDPQLLLCFRLSPELQKARDTGSQSVMIHRFDETPEILEWDNLAVVPGWESDQICATLDHLSILALAVDFGAEPTATPRHDQATPSGYRGPYPYSLPDDRDG